jgi:hypothetical protein
VASRDQNDEFDRRQYRVGLKHYRFDFFAFFFFEAFLVLVAAFFGIIFLATFLVFFTCPYRKPNPAGT